MDDCWKRCTGLRSINGLLVMLLATCAVSGCSSGRTALRGAANGIKETVAWRRMKPKPPELKPDTVQLHYIILEGSSSDHAAEDLWAAVDEQAIPMDVQSKLRANGLRVARVGTRLPPELLGLVKEHSASGRLHGTRAGELVKVQLTEVLPECQLFSVDAGAPPRGQQLADAQGFIHVVPSLDATDGVQLSLAPEVEHGQVKNQRIPTPDLSGWQWKTERDKLTFPNLKVDLDVASGEYILVGSWPPRAGTLGHHFFIRERDGKPVPTALLVRAVRPTSDDLYMAGYDLDEFFLTNPGPTNTAVQATAAARRPMPAAMAAEQLASRR